MGLTACSEALLLCKERLYAYGSFCGNAAYSFQKLEVILLFYPGGKEFILILILILVLFINPVIKLIKYIPHRKQEMMRKKEFAASLKTLTLKSGQRFELKDLLRYEGALTFYYS